MAIRDRGSAPAPVPELVRCRAIRPENSQCGRRRHRHFWRRQPMRFLSTNVLQSSPFHVAISARLSSKRAVAWEGVQIPACPSGRRHEAYLSSVGPNRDPALARASVRVRQDRNIRVARLPPGWVARRRPDVRTWTLAAMACWLESTRVPLRPTWISPWRPCPGIV